MRKISRRNVASDAVLRAITLGAPLALLSAQAGATPSGEATSAKGASSIEAAMSVLAFGAIGDGVADDTPAFRAALVAGASVFVPPGTYRLTATLNVDGATLFGTGPQSILRCDTPDFDLLEISGSGSRIRNLTISGAATTSSTHQTGIITSKTSPPDDFSVTDVRFGGDSTTTGLNVGIKFEDKARNCRIHNNHFERLLGAHSSGYGILTGAVDGLTVTGNTFEGSRVDGYGRHAVYVSAGGRRVTVSNNIVRDFNSEALTTNAYPHHRPVEQLVFANNVIHRCGGEGANQSSISVTGKASTVRIEGNIIVESFGCGILCDAGIVLQENISIDGNTVIDSAYMGIRQLGALQQTVRDNYVRGSSRVKPGTWADIVVGAGAFAPQQILVSGNQCVPLQGISYKPFVLNASKPYPASIRISGNDFPSAGYTGPPDYATGVMQPLIDGRLQFRSPWQPPPLADKAIAEVTFPVVGAEPGDIVACTHPAARAGIALSGIVEKADSVTVTLINHTGDQPGDRPALPGGILSIDVWKR